LGFADEMKVVLYRNDVLVVCAMRTILFSVRPVRSTSQ
jgi:hypothetical protein